MNFLPAIYYYKRKLQQTWLQHFDDLIIQNDAPKLEKLRLTYLMRHNSSASGFYENEVYPHANPVFLLSETEIPFFLLQKLWLFWIKNADVSKIMGTWE